MHFVHTMLLCSVKKQSINTAYVGSILTCYYTCLHCILSLCIGSVLTKNIYSLCFISEFLNSTLKFNTTALMQDHTTLRSVVPGSPTYYIIFCIFIASFLSNIPPNLHFFPYFKALCAGLHALLCIACRDL